LGKVVVLDKIEMNFTVAGIGSIICHQNWLILSSSEPDFGVLSIGNEQYSVFFIQRRSWSIIGIARIVNFD